MKNKGSPRPFGVLPTSPSAPFRPLSLLSSPLCCLTRWAQPHPLLSSPLPLVGTFPRTKSVDGQSQTSRGQDITKKKKGRGWGSVHKRETEPPPKPPVHVLVRLRCRFIRSVPMSRNWPHLQGGWDGGGGQSTPRLLLLKNVFSLALQGAI